MHRQPSGAAAARGAGGVDGELGDAGVAVARAVCRRRGEGDHLAVTVLNHDDRMASVEPPHHVVRGAVPRLERGHAVVDAVVVDARDRRRVGGRAAARTRLSFAGQLLHESGTL